MASSGQEKTNRMKGKTVMPVCHGQAVYQSNQLIGMEMFMWSKLIKNALASVLLLGLASAANVASAQIVGSNEIIVNVNAYLNGADTDAPGLNTPVPASLKAGKYRLELVDPTTPGAYYSAWNAWGRVGNCDATGQCSDNGWLNFVRFDSGPNTPVHILGDFTIWSSAVLSFAHTKTLPTYIVDLKESKTLRFFIADSFHKDNLGGVSVRITPIKGFCSDPRGCVCDAVDLCFCQLAADTSGDTTGDSTGLTP